MAIKADGSVSIKANVDVANAQKELKKLEADIEKTEQALNDKKTEKSGIEAQLEDAKVAADNARKSVEALENKIKGAKRILSGEVSSAPGAYIEAYENLPEWEKQLPTLDKAFGEKITTVDNMAQSATKLGNEIAASEQNLDAMKSRAGELHKKLAASEKNAGGMNKATAKAANSAAVFANRLKAVVRSALIFTVITQALAKLREWFGKVLQTSEEFRKATAKLKGALLTLVQPLVNVLIPALTRVVELLTRVATTAAEFLSKMFGSSIEASRDSAEALYEETKALDETGKAAKKAQRSLAGFDEINTLSTDGGGSTGAENGAPDFTGIVGGAISDITALVTGLGLLAVGAVLTFTGASIPAGLAMMAAGALLTYNAATSDPTLAQKLIEGPIGAIISLVSTSLLAVGAILAFTGANIPLGIGLMAAGAAGIVAMATISPDALGQMLTGPIGAVTAIISGAALAVGGVLAFTGFATKIGIALMAVGAAGLVATAAANPDVIVNALKGPVGKVTAILSGALLAVGGILTFTGAKVPLGIGLMAAGAVGLAATATVNWNTIANAMQGPVGTVTAILGSALLAIGAILLFTGANIPLGLGLLVAGGASLATAIAPNWNTIVDAVKSVWTKIKQYWNNNIAPVFTAQWWGNLAKRAMNGLIAAVESGLNFVLSGAGGFVNDLTGLLNKIPGVNIGAVDWGHVRIPRLATGAVIPPNREFLAVLGDQKSGTNIEAPEALIRKIVREEAGGNTELLAEILDAIRAGRVMKVDKRILAQVTAEGINDMTKQTGKPVLLY